MVKEGVEGDLRGANTSNNSFLLQPKCHKVGKNPIHYSRIKHFDLNTHFIKDLVEKGMVKLRYYLIQDQVTDIFTKLVEKISICVDKRHDCWSSYQQGEYEDFESLKTT